MTGTEYGAAVVIGGVENSYRHRSKLIVPGELLVLPSARLKWYDIHPSENPVDPGVRDRAHRFLASEVAAGRLRLSDDLGFVLLHRCGESFYFLLVSVWRGNNELWETVYTCDGGEFAPVEGGHTRATFCVWELGAVWHEQQAWSRFLYSARDEPALTGWLADRYAGEV